MNHSDNGGIKEKLDCYLFSYNGYIHISSVSEYNYFSIDGLTSSAKQKYTVCITAQLAFKAAGLPRVKTLSIKLLMRRRRQLLGHMVPKNTVKETVLQDIHGTFSVKFDRSMRRDELLVVFKYLSISLFYLEISFIYNKNIYSL